MDEAVGSEKKKKEAEGSFSTQLEEAWDQVLSAGHHSGPVNK